MDKPNDQQQKDTPGSPGNGSGQPSNTITDDAVRRIVEETIAKEREASRRIQQQAELRSNFIASDLSGLKNLPQVYKDLLGNDPAKWSDEAARIVKTYEQDYKESGGRLDSAGDPNSLGGSPSSEHRGPDGRTGAQMIAAGLAKRRAGNLKNTH